MNNDETQKVEIIKDDRSKYLIGEGESKTKEELYAEELQDVKEQLNTAQEAIDFLIEIGGDV